MKCWCVLHVFSGELVALRRVYDVLTATSVLAAQRAYRPAQSPRDNGGLKTRWQCIKSIPACSSIHLFAMMLEILFKVVLTLLSFGMASFRKV